MAASAQSTLGHQAIPSKQPHPDSIRVLAPRQRETCPRYRAGPGPKPGVAGVALPCHEVHSPGLSKQTGRQCLLRSHQRSRGVESGHPAGRGGAGARPASYCTALKGALGRALSTHITSFNSTLMRQVLLSEETFRETDLPKVTSEK